MKKSDLFFAFLLLPVDIAMIIVAFILAYYLRIDLEVVPVFSDIGLREYLKYSIYLLPVWIALMAVGGLYYIQASRSLFRELYRIVSASSTAMIILVMLLFLTKTIFFSRLILGFTWIISILSIFLGRVIIKIVQNFLLKYGVGCRNVVLIGDNKTSESVIYHLSRAKNRIYKIFGVLNGNAKRSSLGLKIIESADNLQKIIHQYKIDEVVLTDVSISRSKMLNIIQICSDNKVTFKYIPDTFSLMTLNISSETIGSMPVMELQSIPLDGWGRIVKRIIDMTFSFLGLVLLSPVFLLISILEKTTSRGPIIFSHERIGRDGNIFMCHKFRSMFADKCDSKKGGSKWTTAKDEKTRVTTLGRFLRKSNLDELPQLWNILVGDMSFVGPRPEQPKLVKRFEKEIPNYFRRHKVKAGLTGWAQVNGLKGDTSISERVRYDIFYIENWSFWFDAKIFIKTIGIVIYELTSGKYEYRARS